MKYKALALLAVSAMFAGCGENSITTASDEAKTTATITFKVVDSNTGLPVDSASVYSVLKKDSSLTDINGVSVWKNNVIGDYNYIISKPGFASQLSFITIGEQGKGDVARVGDKIETVTLHRQGAIVNGTILKEDPHTQNLTAASKINVIIKFADPKLYPSEVSTITDASGVFSFSNLPEGTDYTLIVPQANMDGQTYSTESSLKISGLRAGETYNTNQIKMKLIALSPELVQSNLANLDTAGLSSIITISFSTALIADSVPTAWKIYKNSRLTDDDVCDHSGNEVLISAALDLNQKTVAIRSLSNMWNRTRYCLEGVATTPQGASRTFAMEFNPGSITQRPSNLPLIAVNSDDYPTAITLMWNTPTESISGYKIFYKTDDMADIILLANIDSQRTTYQIDYPKSRFGVDAKAVMFYVLPYATINGLDVTSEPGSASPAIYTFPMESTSVLY